MGFELDLTAFTKKLGNDSDSLIRKVAFAAVQGVMMETPVKTGRARMSWRVKFGSPSTQVATKRKRAATVRKGSPASPRELNGSGINRVLQARKIKRDIYISNALPYAVALEKGHSRQSSGMVQRTLESVKHAVETGAIKP